MDHLPIPPEFRDRGLSVPRLCASPAYDGHGFEGFPSRVGIDVDNLPLRRPEDVEPPSGETLRSRLQTKSFVQVWLWFGFMHEFELACEFETVHPTPHRETGKKSLIQHYWLDMCRRLSGMSYLS